MVTIILVNIGSGNGLLPDGTKPLPEPVLTFHLWGSVVFTLEQFRSQCPSYYSVYRVWNLKYIFKITTTSVGNFSYPKTPTKQYQAPSTVSGSFLAATKQLYEWFSPSVCLSVCLWRLFHYVLIIVSSWNFQDYYQWQKWCPCKRSRSEVKGQGHRGQNPT